MLARFIAVLGLLALAAWTGGPALARGNLASRPTEIKLDIKGDLTMSAKEFKLETGKYYKLAVTVQGGDEFRFMAPDMWLSAWINQVVIAGIEIHNVASPEIEFDKDGTATIYFVPVRTGRFKFYVKGHEERGLAGQFIVE